MSIGIVLTPPICTVLLASEFVQSLCWEEALGEDDMTSADLVASDDDDREGEGGTSDTTLVQDKR